MVFSRIDKTAFSTLGNAYLLAFLARGAEILFFVSLFFLFTVEEVGLYSWGIAVSAFFAIAIDLGLNQVLIRNFSRRAIGVGFALKGSMMIRFPLILICFAVLAVWGNKWNPSSESFRVVVLASTIQLFVAAENFCFAWLRSHSRQNVANALGVLDPVGRLAIFFFICVLLHEYTAVGLLTGIVIWHIPVIIVSAVVVARLHGAADRGPVTNLSLSAVKNQLLLPGMVFCLIGLITVMQNRLDWLLVAHFTGQVELANYAVANKAYEMLMLMGGIAMTTIYPWLCRESAKSAFIRRLNIITTGVLACGSAFALGAALYLPQVMEWVWGDKYQSAYGLVRILLPISVISIAIMILYYRLIARGMETTLLKASIVVTIIQLLVNISTIPVYGAVGAVFGMASLAVCNYAFYAQTARRVGVMSNQSIVRQVCFVLIMFVIGVVIKQFDMPMYIGLVVLCVSCASAWFAMMLTYREQQWLKVYIGRLRVQMRGNFRTNEV